MLYSLPILVSREYCARSPWFFAARDVWEWLLFDQVMWELMEDQNVSTTWKQLFYILPSLYFNTYKFINKPQYLLISASVS